MLLLYSNVVTTRSNYVFELVFDLMGLKYQITNDKLFFENYQLEKINYSNDRLRDEFFIKSSSLLLEDFIKKANVIVEDKFQSKVLFPNDSSCDLGFDIFSATFYMVSRYEEYVPFTPDQFGRYPSTDSLAYRNGFLNFPVVNIWAAIFKNILLEKFPLLETKNSAFNAIVTYDIDVAFKFRGRNFIRMMGAFVKDILKFKIKNIYKRKLTLLKFQKDPWDVYDELAGTIIQNKLHSIFFFLLADNSPNDRNLSHKNPLMRSLIKQIMAFSEIGIHPSFKTSSIPEKISIEKERLEKICGKKITKSRQHYLKFILPDTYNHLIAAGITEDYSMGFADRPGFRAGTCTPFYFYDLKNEKATSLKIFPVTCMEVNFIDYMQTKPDEGLQQILTLMEQVKNVNGSFISIWHNNSIGDGPEFREWKKVHNRMINHAVTYLRQ